MMNAQNVLFSYIIQSSKKRIFKVTLQQNILFKRFKQKVFKVNQGTLLLLPVIEPLALRHPWCSIRTGTVGQGC